MSQWSHSRIQSYRDCARKFFFRYVAKVKLPEEPETLAQFLGGRVHDALEALYAAVKRNETPALDGVLAHFRARWDEKWHDAVMMPDERPPLAHREQAEGWLRDYWARHAPFTETRTIDVERRISFPLDDDGAHTMIGFVDRLARRADGTWQIHDYKTNRRLPTQQDKDRDPQLAYYEIGVRRMWPDDVKAVELVWHFLAFDTSITSVRTGEQLDTLRGEALATIAEIESLGRSEAAFPTHESVLCDYCEYQQVCPVRRHRFAVATLPPSRFAKESGVKLVAAWAERDAAKKALQAQLDEVEAEIGEIKAALAAYAEAHDLEVVTGEEREATVKRSERVVFPRKSESDEAEEAQALEAQLRGSPWWPDASAVDRFALDRLWRQRAGLAADLRALLEEYARTEPTLDVRLRKKKG